MFEQPEQKEEQRETSLYFASRSWWFGKRIEIEITGSAKNVQDIAKRYLPHKESKRDVAT